MKINLKWKSVAAVLAASSLISPVYADEGKFPRVFPISIMFS
jgi:hypothetical protein